MRCYTGIMMVDYFVVRRGELNLDALYSSDPAGEYWYAGGWNPAALTALAAGLLPTLPGLYGMLTGTAVAPAWRTLYSAGWFVGCGVAAAAYAALMRRAQLRPEGAAAT